MNNFFDSLIFQTTQILMIKMPDESCRKCGGPMIESKKCSECNQAFRWVCANCNQQTLEQFHFSCKNSFFYIKNKNNCDYGVAAIG